MGMAHDFNEGIPYVAQSWSSLGGIRCGSIDGNCGAGTFEVHAF